MKRAALVTLSLFFLSNQALAVGERVDGFPTWAERVHHQLANRARVDPQLEMQQCGANCAEAACYTPAPPLTYKNELNRAARFHADHQSKNGYFAHTSSCTLVSDIGTLYPDQCDGSASCACVGGVNSCNPSCSTPSQRVSRFNTGYAGEIIASGGSPLSAFYLWLYEDAGGDASCQFTFDNGHRWLLLTANGSVGFGVSGVHVGDFGGGGAAHPIASGAHWPRSGSSVEAWANWYAQAGPESALVNVDGECVAMQLERGTATNGAYKANLTGLSGCSRYFFLFRDQNDQLVTYPETGSLGIGPEAGCADWSTERPTTGASCDCAPQCDGMQCGDDACGGSCGTCAEGDSCELGLCIPPDGGSGGQSSVGGGSSSPTGSGTGGDPGTGGAVGTAVGGDDPSAGQGGLAAAGDGGAANGLEGVVCSFRPRPGPARSSWLWVAAGLALVSRRRRA